MLGPRDLECCLGKAPQVPRIAPQWNLRRWPLACREVSSHWEGGSLDSFAWQPARGTTHNIPNAELLAEEGAGHPPAQRRGQPAAHPRVSPALQTPGRHLCSLVCAGDNTHLVSLLAPPAAQCFTGGIKSPFLKKSCVGEKFLCASLQSEEESQAQVMV